MSSELVWTLNKRILEECITNESGRPRRKMTSADSPECLFEEDSEEADTNTRADLNDNFNKITASLEVLAYHEGRRFPHQRYGDAH